MVEDKKKYVVGYFGTKKMDVDVMKRAVANANKKNKSVLFFKKKRNKKFVK